MVVVEPGLADAADAGVGGEGAEQVDGVVRRFVDVAGMDADADGDLGVGGGYGEVRVEVVQVGDQADDAGDVGLAGAIDQGGDFGGIEAVAGEVAMRVGEHGGVSPGGGSWRGRRGRRG